MPRECFLSKPIYKMHATAIEANNSNRQSFKENVECINQLPQIVSLASQEAKKSLPSWYLVIKVANLVTQDIFLKIKAQISLLT